MGKWNIIRESFAHIECSECGSVIAIDSNEDFAEWKFCPICGASMNEEAEEPCRFRDCCVGACEWCKSHDYSEACVPMLQETLKNTRDALAVASEVLLTMTKEKENK